MNEQELVEIDFVIARIGDLRVNVEGTPDELACIMTMISQAGEQASVGFSREAFEELVRALVENSPRVPGTPGRN